jgi:hypothetical protein
MIRVTVETYHADADGSYDAVDHCYGQQFEALDLPALIRYLNPVPDEVEKEGFMAHPRPLLPEEN